jgi:hypothetical protein
VHAERMHSFTVEDGDVAWIFQAGSAADMHEWLEVISTTVRTIKANTQPPWGIPGQIGVGWAGGRAGEGAQESQRRAKEGDSGEGLKEAPSSGGKRRMIGKVLMGAWSLGSCSRQNTEVRLAPDLFPLPAPGREIPWL